jgi:hypothetical protein
LGILLKAVILEDERLSKNDIVVRSFWIDNKTIKGQDVRDGKKDIKLL